MNGTTTSTSVARRPVVVATRNEGKLAELRALLGPRVAVRTAAELGVELPEETGATFVENAILKARAVADATGAIAIADDSGLEVEALGGRPGVYSARYAGEDATDAGNRRKLLDALEGVPPDQRQARFVCAIAIVDGDEVVTTAGHCAGAIGFQEKGTGGFGYDSVFVLPDGRTMAELPASEKNRISHRALAMRHALPLISDRLHRQDWRPEPSTTTEDD